MVLQLEMVERQWNRSRVARRLRMAQLKAELAALDEQHIRDAQLLSACQQTYGQLENRFTAGQEH